MHPFLFTFLTVFLLTAFAPLSHAQTSTWPGYPSELPQFDLSGERLQQNWGELTALIHIPFPDADWVEQTLRQYPLMNSSMLAAASQADAPASLTALRNGDYQPLAMQLQQVWRLHYSGQYQQAYELGITLGPIGEIAANYARLMNASFILQDKTAKLAEYRACEVSSLATLKLAPDYALADYGLVYARVRILELLDSSAARATGYIGFAQNELKTLMARYPDEPVYLVTQGGLEAGIVARVGSFLATLTYGVSEDSALSAFNNALKIPKAHKPTVFNEFATAMQRMNPSSFRSDIRRLKSLCANADVISAEEALVKQACMAEQSL